MMGDDPAEVRLSWEARRQKAIEDRDAAERRIHEADEVLHALDVLEGKGIAVPVGRNGAVRCKNGVDDPLCSKVRSTIESEFRGTKFSNTQIREKVQGNPTRVRVRRTLDLLVDNGFIKVTRKGYKGRAALYKLVQPVKSSKGGEG